VRKLTAETSRTNTSVIFINQLRQKIGVVFGNPETTTGGHALRFFASVRLDVRRIGKTTVGEAVVGNRTRVKVVKNKCAPPFQEAEFDIRWGVGIDPWGELVDLSLEGGLLQKNGNHIVLDGKSIAPGRERAREVVAQNADLRRALLAGLSRRDAAAPRAEAA
jgi:recombination protein RecA